MRKNRTKHEAKKPRLAKRALALCFALIFVCSCLLPVFAHSEENLLMQETVVEEQQDEQPMLNEGGTDSTEGGTNPTGDNEDSTGSGTNPTEETKPAEQSKPEGTTEEPKVEEQPKTEETKPEETKPEGTTEESKGTTEETKTEGTTEESKDTAGETKPEEPKQPTTNTTGDTIEQGKATYTYRFWPDKIDAFELEAINDAVKSGTSLNDAAQSRARMVPCTVLTVMTNANLRDYQANVQQPTKDGYEFAGWYTVDGTTEDEFSFEQSLNFEKSKTIDVFAKWVSVAEKNAEKYRGWYENLVNTSDRYTLEELAEEYSKDDGFKEYINALSDDDFATLMEKFDAEIDEDAVYEMDEDEGEYGIAMASIMPDVPASQKIVTVGNSVTLRTSYYDYYDRGTHRWTSSNTSVATVTGNKNYLGYPTNTAVVKGVSEGTVTITHTYTSSSGTTQTDKVTLRVVSSKEDKNGAYYLYCYTLIPGKVADTSEAADKVWNGMGVGSVTGLGAPSKDNHITGQRLDDGYGSSGALITYPDDYPDITYGGKTYHYAKTAEQRYQEGYYTITWFRILQAGGANTGNNGHNPVVDDKILTYHLDGQINLNEKDIVTLDFKLKDAGEDNYELVDPETYSRRVSVGTNLGELNPTLKVPSEAATKEVGGFTYDFDGWYDNENCAGSRVNFSNYQVNKKTTFYGRYVPRDTMQEDKPFITVEKNVVGIEEGLLSNNFFVKVGTKYLYANRAKVVKKSPDGKSWTLRWTIPNATEGIYDVSEEGEGVPNYTVVKREGLGSVTTKNAQTTVREVKYETKCSTTDFDVTKTATDDFVFAAALTTGGVQKTVIISRDPLSANVRKKIESFIQTYSGNWKPNYVYYSVYKNGTYVSNFVIEGKKITYNGTQIRLDKTKDWTHVATLAYDISGGINPEVSITNTYTPNTLDIQITKKVDSGDKAKAFEFKVTGDDLSTTNNVWLTVGSDSTKQKPQDVFKLKDGESATLHGLKEGYIFTIEELKNSSIEYDTTATENIKVEAGNTKSFRYKVVNENGQLVLQPIAENDNSPLSGKSNITNGEVVVTNSAAATSLTVKKTVKDGNAAAPAGAEFTFQLTVKNAPKVYQKVKLTKDGKDITESSVQSSKYQWKFTLKDGESVYISGIRIDDENVKVEEVGVDTHYTTMHSVNNGTAETGTTATIFTATLSANQSSGTTVEFTNTYSVPDLESMTIKKVVTGAFGERTKDFTFSVTMTHAKPALIDDVTASGAATKDNLGNFTMNHGGSVTLENIPIGTTITVTEKDANDYKTSATGHSKSISSGERTFTYTVMEEGGKAVLKSSGTDSKGFDGNTITVENNFDGNPDTGVLLDTLPYLILLAVAVAGGVLVVVRKHKHRDE